jgi:hypothetical protein
MASDFTVDRASKKYVLGADGFLKEYANDEPAIEFNADGSYKGVLVEPQSINLITYSEDFSSWTPLTPPTLTNNYGTSPDGLQNSTRIVGTAGNRIYLPIIGSSATYTYSIYAKGSGQIKIRDNTATYFLDISLTSEWARYYFTFTASYTTVQIQLTTTTDGEIWGAQIEESPIATSYIPTNGSTVTRVKDDIYLTSASSLIGQTEGTLFAEVDWRVASGQSQRIMSIFNSGTLTDIIDFYRNNSPDNIRVNILVDSVQEQNAQSSYVGTTGIKKIAVAYKTNDTKIFLDGSELASTTSGDLSNLNLDNVNFGQNVLAGDQANMWIRAVALYTSRLTDTECQDLTTL